MNRIPHLLFAVLLAGLLLARLLNIVMAQAPVITTHYDLETGLLSMYPLWEKTGTRFDLHGANDLTDINTVQQADGIIGRAALYDSANNERLESLADGGLSTGGGDFTVAVWVSATDASGSETFIRRLALTPSRYEYTLWHNGVDTIFWQVYDTATAGNKTASITCGTKPNTFYLIGRIVTGTMKLFCNDTYASGTTLVTPFYTDTVMTSVAVNGFDGIIDEAAFWDRALTDAEVDYLYNGGAWRNYDAGEYLSQTIYYPPLGSTYSTTLPSGLTGVFNVTTTAGEGGIILGIALLAVLQITTLIVSITKDGAVKWQR